MTSLELGKKKQDAERYYAAENSVKEIYLFKRIRDYYEARPEYLDTVQQKSSGLSLRRLDAIVTKNTLGNVCYYLRPRIKLEDDFGRHLVAAGWDRHAIPFNMVASYEQQLKHYQKRYFDSFRRRSKVDLDGFETSYCQLNFFLWLHQYKLLPHLEVDQQQEVPKKKNKAVKDQLILYAGPLVLPAVPGPPLGALKLLLRPDKEYALLQRAIYYYRIEPLKDLGRFGSFQRL